MKHGRLLILSGPSGVGKDTVIDAWSQCNPLVERVVAYTTRAPRSGEIEGKDYRFVSEARFLQHVDEGDFLEHKLVHGNYYATPLRNLEELLSQGKIAVLKIDVQGALSVMELRGDAITVFLLPPSSADLESRLRGRGTDDPAVISKRLATAKEELALSNRYQYRLVNDKVESVVEQLEQICSQIS